jgi:Flp pilus assembly protein TadG
MFSVVRRGRPPRWLKAFAMACGGAAAVEFAFVAPPFLALLIASFDLAILFFAQASRETAVEKTARLVLTGQALSNGLTAAQFQADVCAALPSAFNCSGVMVDLQTASSFSSATTSAPTLTYNASGQVTNTWKFQVGGPGTIEVMRVMYQWPVFPGPLSLNFANLSNGSYLLMATSVFRNEPP